MKKKEREKGKTRKTEEEAKRKKWKKAKKKENQNRKNKRKRSARNDKYGLPKNLHFCFENTGEAPSNVWFSWEQSAFSGCEGRLSFFPGEGQTLAERGLFPMENGRRDLILEKRDNYM